MVVDDQLTEKISHGARLNELRDVAAANGMKLLRSDGVEKVVQGITTLDEVYRVTA
jgi:type IV pilus assembly protein PilB